jgi:hypothetical protein
MSAGQCASGASLAVLGEPRAIGRRLRPIRVTIGKVHTNYNSQQDLTELPKLIIRNSVSPGPDFRAVKNRLMVFQEVTDFFATTFGFEATSGRVL